MVPFDQVKKLVHTLHNSNPSMTHLGCNKRLKLLRVHYSWQGMQHTAQDAVKDWCFRKTINDVYEG